MAVEKFHHLSMPTHYSFSPSVRCCIARVASACLFGILISIFDNNNVREKTENCASKIMLLFGSKTFPMSPHVRLSVGRSIGSSVCHNFKFHFPSSYRSIYFVLDGLYRCCASSISMV